MSYHDIQLIAVAIVSVIVGGWSGYAWRDLVDRARDRQARKTQAPPLGGAEPITGPQSRGEGVRLIRVK